MVRPRHRGAIHLDVGAPGEAVDGHLRTALLNRRAGLRWLAALVLAVSCGSSTSVPRDDNATKAVEQWLGHLAAHDDAAAFADLAPRSQAVVGDVENYRRGSGRFGSVYAGFAAGEVRAPLELARGLVVVTLVRTTDVGPALSAVPVRRVQQTWRVDPLLDAGSYSFQPDDGAAVPARPTFTVQLDDPATRATVWFDGEPAPSSGPTFRPKGALSSGWHVVTVALVRGDDVVARAVRLHVTS